MKKFFAAGLLAAGFFMTQGVASAQNVFNENVGCGLGNVLIKERDSTLYQILAVTTNGTLGNQTFGISSGTLECRQPARFVKDEKVKRFVADNMDTLARDIASGKGESVETLAELMAIPEGKKAEFFTVLQANFENIYASEGVQSADVIDSIAAII